MAKSISSTESNGSSSSNSSFISCLIKSPDINEASKGLKVKKSTLQDCN